LLIKNIRVKIDYSFLSGDFICIIMLYLTYYIFCSMVVTYKEIKRHIQTKQNKFVFIWRREIVKIRNFLIIKPEGIIYIKEILGFLKLDLSKCDVFLIENWMQLSRELYAHYFDSEERVFNYENLLFSELSLFGNKALCIIFNKFNYNLFLRNSLIKNNLRKYIYSVAHVESIYHFLNVNAIGRIMKKDETLYIKYDYNKEDKKISDKGYYQIQRFTYIHMPDPDLRSLIRECKYLATYLSPSRKLIEEEKYFIMR